MAGAGSQTFMRWHFQLNLRDPKNCVWTKILFAIEIQSRNLEMRKILEFKRKSVLCGQDHGAEEPTRKVLARNGCKISHIFARE